MKMLSPVVNEEAAPMLAAQEAIPTTEGDAMATDKLAAGCAAATTEQQPTTGDEPAAAVAIDEEEINDSAIAHKLHLALNCRSRRANKTLEGPAVVIPQYCTSIACVRL